MSLVLDHLRRRHEAADAARAVLTEAARARAEVIAEWLVRSLGATEVWLFGSVAAGLAHQASDIDLAVRGVDPSKLAESRAAVGDLGEPYDVDLVALEHVSAAWGEPIRARGIKLR